MFTCKTLLSVGVTAVLTVACQRTSWTSASSEPSNQTNAPVSLTNALVAADPLAGVENRDRVRRYADETQLSPPQTARLITGFMTEIRESPTGESINTVQSTEPVTVIARDRRGEYSLVVYSDPADASKKLAGWVYKDALEGSSWTQNGAPIAATLMTLAEQSLSCPEGQDHLRKDHDFCGQACSSDAACDRTKGEQCDGLAFRVNDKTQTLTTSGYCVVPSYTGMP